MQGMTARPRCVPQRTGIRRGPPACIMTPTAPAPFGAPMNPVREMIAESFITALYC